MSTTLTPETTSALCEAIFYDGVESHIIDINDSTKVITPADPGSNWFSIITNDALIRGLDAYARDIRDADNPIVAAIKTENYLKVARLINEDRADHTDPDTGLYYEHTGDYDIAAHDISAHVTHIAAFKLDLPHANDQDWDEEAYPELFN